MRYEEMIENWTSKIEKSNSAYDEARIVEQWSMDFLNRAGWNEIVEDTINETEEYFDNELEKLKEKLSEVEKNEHQEIIKHIHRLMKEDKDIGFNVSTGVVRDKK